MKKILLIVTALIMSALTYAQVQVATLQHGDSIRVFYTSHALIDAYNAAVAGDVISLSAGAFDACNITKDSLTIRGVGYRTPSPRTVISSGIYIGTSDRTTHLTIEGVRVPSFYINSSNYSVVLQCQNMYIESLGNYFSGQFVNCIIQSFAALNGTQHPTFINCVLKNYRSNSSGPSLNSECTYINCVHICDNHTYDWGANTISSNWRDQFINCIIIAATNYSNYARLHQACYVDNCIGLNLSTAGGINFFSNCELNTNSRMATTSIFSNFDLDEMNPERYILTDSAQTALLGSDGTQVGLYGGFMPYSSEPSYPVITRMNVSRRTTADGRLSVDIQVGNVEQSEDDE